MPMLYLPEITQWGPTANHDRTDCGPASVAMVLFLYSLLGNLTVDDLSAETTLAFSDNGLPPSALVQLAARHGLTLENRAGTTLQDIRDEIDAGRPVIALVAYRFITGRLDQGDNNPLTDGHFFVILGYSGNFFTVNDPDYWAPYVERGHETLISMDDLDRALAGDNFNSQVLFVKDLTVNDQVIALLNQAITLLQQPPAPPPPPPSATVIAVTVSVKANIRQRPTTTSTIVGVGIVGTVLNVVDANVSADGHQWYQIHDGAFMNFYIAQDVVVPKP